MLASDNIYKIYISLIKLNKYICLKVYFKAKFHCGSNKFGITEEQYYVLWCHIVSF